MPCLTAVLCRHDSGRLWQQLQFRAEPSPEVQHVALNANVTSGTYQLRYNYTEGGQLASDVSGAIAWNSTPEAALLLLPGLADAGLAVSQVSCREVIIIAGS